MRFKDFLKEGYKFLTKDECSALIKKDCKPFLKKHESGFYYYRGMKGAGGGFGVKDVRKDRNPSDSPPAMQAVLNLANRTHKLPPRSEVMFATRNERQADHYGSSYIVIPAGKFKCFYYPEINDAFNTVDDWDDILIQWTRKSLGKRSDLAKKIDKMKHIKEFFDYILADEREMARYNDDLLGKLSKVVKNKLPKMFIGELNFICDKYYYMENTEGNMTLLDKLADEI